MTEPHSDAAEEAGSWAEIFTGRYGIYTFILNLGMLLFAINQFVVATIMPSVRAHGAERRQLDADHGHHGTDRG